MPARRIKSLHFNLKEGENVVFHREHRSKKGKKRNNWYIKDQKRQYRDKKEALALDIDKESLRMLKKRHTL